MGFQCQFHFLFAAKMLILESIRLCGIPMSIPFLLCCQDAEGLAFQKDIVAGYCDELREKDVGLMSLRNSNSESQSITSPSLPLRSVVKNRNVVKDLFIKLFKKEVE